MAYTGLRVLSRNPKPTDCTLHKFFRGFSHKALFYGLENSGYFVRFLANLNSGQSQSRKENRAKTNQTSG